jgi:hypothetical protein
MERGMDIDDFVEQLEAEHGSDALVRARQSLARTAYGQGPETFTRLRLAAGKSVRQVLKALPPSLVITEEDIAQATFDITDEGLLVAVAGIVGVDKARPGCSGRTRIARRLESGCRTAPVSGSSRTCSRNPPITAGRRMNYLGETQSLPFCGKKPA